MLTFLILFGYLSSLTCTVSDNVIVLLPSSMADSTNLGQAQCCQLANKMTLIKIY